MDSLIRSYQLVLLEMLYEIDRICQSHNIAYMLFAGTALGAVRHKGFIPWDDDLDIIMLRKDYERFLKLAPNELDAEKYFLQKEYSEHWPMFYSKLRKNNTACLERLHPRDAEMHQGAFVDIFPADNLSSGKLIGKLQFYASRVVIAKALCKRGYETDSVRKKLFMLACRLVPKQPLWLFTVNRRGTASAEVHSFFGASSKYEKSTYPRAWFHETVRVKFEDGAFPVSKHCGELLTRLYGDYMKAPPEGERAVKAHAMKIDTEHSYKEYIEWQKNQRITEYTRSIR